ncbi:MAG: hypothetical protein ABI305_11485 [Tepidiformaceae bacterium]
MDDQTQLEPTAAPAISLTAIVSKRKLVFNDVPVPTLLVLVAQETAGLVDPIFAAVREKYPLASQVQIATIIDTHKFPAILKKFAEGLMKGRYNESAKNMEPGKDPADYLLIVPDWKAAASKALGLTDTSEHLAIAVVAPGGKLIGTDQSADTAAAAMALLAAAGAK